MGFNFKLDQAMLPFLKIDKNVESLVK